ncbi:zinc finger protein 511-like [Actinia tenebrosa]|uniref:Zinc finger protein 511-like n=1 Tax=Actinia tenebrosa TaxID=6105 RepID=A0A6P8I4H0_ACTTE|nr:zinc finger protein 511-like [Actinia tenebrosa]
MALVWSYRPFKRLLPPGHPFFEEGDIFCNILRKQVNLGEDLEEIIESAEPEFECSVHGCHECFTSTVRYEAHYRSCHWNRCRFCKKTFQTSFLLDLHILENHDTLFQMIARKKHMYRCLVESCPDKFNGEEERKKHLVELHQYPSDFRFNRTSRLQRKMKRKQAESTTSIADSAQKSPTDLPMDTDSTTQHDQNGKPTTGENNNSASQKQRLPRAICFGRGSSRGFQRGSAPKGHGKGKNKKKQGMSKPPIPSTEVVMEDVS